VKAKMLHFALAIIAVLSLAMLSQVTALDEPDANPYILIFGNNARYPIDYGYYTQTSSIVYTDSGNGSLRIKVGMPREDSMNIFGQRIISVSYKASWLNNKDIVLFRGQSGDDLFFDLYEIPYGNHTLFVSASGTLRYCEEGFDSSRLITGSSVKYLNFAVARPISPTIEPTSIPSPTASGSNWQIAVFAVEAILTVSVMAIIIFIIYKKRRGRV
jgi:hypothetical protein